MAAVTAMALWTITQAANKTSFVHYYRSGNFDTTSMLPTSPICVDRCDISGLCGSNGETCTTLVKSYSCADNYAPGKSYAGWCDKTCGYGSCMPEPTPPTSSRSVNWESSYRNFDSPQDVHVTRFDIFGATGDVRLGGEEGVLRLPKGAAYIFTTAPLVTIHDIAEDGDKVYTTYAEEAAWVSKASCLQLDVGFPTTGGNASVIIVSSGKFDATLSNRTADDEKDCVASTMVIGYDSLHNNPVDYVPSGTCANVLGGPGGAADFDDLDSPIRPLVAHYHTRAALYYTSGGTCSFNDPNESPINSGELRFVEAGHYYGPETMWGNDYFVMSFHEADPSARRTTPADTPAGFNPCSFACLDDPSSSDFDASDQLKCVLPPSVS